MISVVVATYRRDQTLSRALESLLSQTYKDFEVVVVDDNGDESWNKIIKAIIVSFSNKLNINYIQNKENIGSARTRNVGINASNGKYVTFLDDDDLYLPNKLKEQFELMEKEDADYSLMNLSLYNEDETLSEIRKRDYLLTNESNNLLLCHLKYHMTGTDTMMFKKDYLLSFGGFESIDVGDEFYLMMKAIEHNGKFVYCESCDVKAYVHTGEDSGLSSGKKKIEGETQLYKFKKGYFKGLKRKDRRYIKMRHYAVLAYAYKRNDKYLCFFIFGLISFLISPICLFSLLCKIKKSR